MGVAAPELVRRADEMHVAHGVGVEAPKRIVAQSQREGVVGNHEAGTARPPFFQIPENRVPRATERVGDMGRPAAVRRKGDRREGLRLGRP